jgi:hypothetical protein
LTAAGAFFTLQRNTTRSMLRRRRSPDEAVRHRRFGAVAWRGSVMPHRGVVR